MSNFVAFVDAGISIPSPDCAEDGRELARALKDKIAVHRDAEQFPIKLLILLVSPVFLEGNRARSLIQGIYGELSSAVPMIGTSVAAVYFNNKIYEDGALLVGIASRLIDVRVGVGRRASEQTKQAIRDLVDAVNPETSAGGRGPKLPHKLLLSFFPGTGDSPIESRKLTQDLHNELWQQVNYRIRIVGGVSSANDPSRRILGLQFAHDGLGAPNELVYADSVVAGMIESGVPIGDNLTNGVDWFRDERLMIKRVSSDGLKIEEFDRGTPDEVLHDKGKIVLFKESARSSDRIMASSENGLDERSIDVLRKMDHYTVLVPGEPTRAAMFERAREGIARAKNARGIKNPIGCFSIKCASHYRHRKTLGLNIEWGIRRLSHEALNGNPYVGGFFEGEIATDRTGRSVYGTWGVGTLVVGDEMSDSGLMRGGYWSMTRRSAALSEAREPVELLRESLKLVHDIGFVGGMISFLLEDGRNTLVKAQMASGPCFEKIEDQTERDLNGRDILARLARKAADSPHFIPDSRADQECDQAAVEKSGIVSQCIIRLKNPKNETLGLFQIDMGDSKYRAELQPEEQRVFRSIAEFVGANLDRIFSWKENEIAHNLDEALVASLSALNMQEGLARFIREAVAAFGVSSGQIRILSDDETHLMLVAGTGEHYLVAKDVRPAISLTEDSPTIAAFKDPSGEPHVINDSQRNSRYLRLLQDYCDHDLMRGALLNAKSYANIRFGTQGNRVGTINLISREPWFFKRYHVRAFVALLRKLEILVDHLDERFLKEAIPDLSEIEDLGNMNIVLNDATDRFRRAIGAGHAALYVRDEAVSVHVLRASSQWRSQEDWVGVAFYGDDDPWIGRRAAEGGKPFYTPDLFLETQKAEYQKGNKRYASQIFGEDLSESFTVEAMAIPLVVGQEYFGVLVLYRRITGLGHQRSTGFVTIDSQLIRRAVSPFAGLVKVAWAYQNTIWDTEYKKQHAKIYEHIPSEDATDFERQICQGLITFLDAAEVHFYRVDADSAPERVTGYRAINREEMMALSPPVMDEQVRSVAGSKLIERSKIIADEEHRRYRGILARACLALLASEGDVVGILDIRWDPERRQSLPLIADGGKSHLLALGRTLGAAFRKHLLTYSANRRRLALNLLTTGVTQTHDFGKNLGNIKALADKLLLERDEFGRTDVAEKIRSAVESVAALLKEKVDLADDVVAGRDQLIDIGDVLDKVLSKRLAGTKTPFEISTDLPARLGVRAVPSLIEEVLANLVKNCVLAMKGREPRPYAGRNPTHELIIVGTKDHLGGQDIVRIQMKHTGEQMPQWIKSQLQRILDGHLCWNPTEKRYMFGIYHSSELLRLTMGGRLDYEHKDGRTVTIIELPWAD